MQIAYNIETASLRWGYISVLAAIVVVSAFALLPSRRGVSREDRGQVITFALGAVAIGLYLMISGHQKRSGCISLLRSGDFIVSSGPISSARWDFAGDDMVRYKTFTVGGVAIHEPWWGSPCGLAKGPVSVGLPAPGTIVHLKHSGDRVLEVTVDSGSN